MLIQTKLVEEAISWEFANHQKFMHIEETAKLADQRWTLGTALGCIISDSDLRVTNSVISTKFQMVLCNMVSYQIKKDTTEKTVEWFEGEMLLSP